MGIILAGDVGGTKTLLCLAESQAEGKPKVLYEARYPSASYEHLSLMVKVFLNQAQEALGYEPQPDRACFGIAGPVINGSSELTNLGWLLERHHLSEELNIENVELINDFAAIGYGVLGMEKSDLFTLQTGKPIAKAPIVILGAGTGLGVAFLTWHGKSYEVYASEGGHADFAPQTEMEIGLLKYLLSRYSRVSVERVVSGKGIVEIYRYLRDSEFAKESEQICDLVHNCDLGKSELDPAAAISEAALTKQDLISEQTMLLFTKLYASEAGNLALRFLPHGGLYFAGGIAPKILPLLQQPQFLAAIKRKGRVSYLLDDIPIHVVMHSGIGLVGAMLYADRL